MPAQTVPDSFWKLLSEARDRLLILDYDGTLAPFTTDRDNAWPYDGVREELAAIRDGGTRIVVITGRSIDDARRLLGLSSPPEIWGSHGHERLLPDGSLRVVELSEATRDALARGEVIARELLQPQAVEVKPACLAVHWRGKPDAEAARIDSLIRELWKPLERSGVTIHAFDGGLELRSNAADKGSAINELIHSLGSPICVAYLGDDLTDEDAFAALSGKGLTVLVRPAWRETQAEAWLRPPEELLQFLARWRTLTNESQGCE